MDNLSGPSATPVSFLVHVKSVIRVLMSWVILACLISLTSELTLELNTAQTTTLHYLDLFFLIFFAADLVLAWKFSRSSKEFFKQNWLNILALIPVIRALRFIRFSSVARLGRLAKLARFWKAGKLAKNMSRGTKTIKRLRKAGKWVLAKRKSTVHNLDQ